MPDLTLRPGDPAPDLSVTDQSGEQLALSSLWQGRPLLLAFLRHYG
jgi:peroxiredoxin